jgi:DNA invertase Pin-like site-specific DNA recombinase
MSDHSTAVAYSYIRFSSPQQAAGDSLRRQTAATSAWCKKNDVKLDTSLSLRDLGVSAFKGRHRDDKHALGVFLKLAERGRIPRGSYLVIENLDRLSREDERKALRLWMDILDAGINIVQLTPETVFRHEKSDMIDVMRAIIELSRGHSESAIKSERLARAWQERKRKGREEGEIVTNRLPAWIEERDGKLRLIPERAAVVKRVFTLAANGYGHGRIARLLATEGVPCFGRSGQWCRAYIACLISRDRRAVGEYQPRFKNGKPDGEPIPGYFPAAVTEAEWLRAQAGKSSRKSTYQRGNPVELQTVLSMYQSGKRVAEIARELKISPPRVYRMLAKEGQYQAAEKGNRAVYLFSKLLVNARDGQAYYPGTRMSKGLPYKALIASTSVEKNGKHAYGFPYLVFERAVLKFLKEINPRDILAGVNGHDDVVKLEAEFGGIEKEIAEASAWMDAHGFSTTIAKRVTALEDRRKEVSKHLAEARQKAANPLSAAWGEAQSLLEVLDSAADKEDARLRLRAAIRRIVDSIHLLVIPRGRDRLAAVQIWFTDKKQHRDYLIYNRSTKANAKTRIEGAWWCRSLADVGALGTLDLRDPEQARRLEAALSAADIESLKA